MSKVIHSDRAHSPLGASAAERWIQCPGSVRLTKDLPDQTSEYAQEGTLAHEIAEAILTGKQPIEETTLTELALYIDYIQESDHDIEYIEDRVAYTDWVEDGFGTADAILLSEEHQTVEIVDLKWGKGIKVNAEGNPQLRLYALGALQKHMFAVDWEIKYVRMTIVQPRLDHISSDFMEVADLFEWADTVVKPAAELALEDDAPLNPSDKACQWCKIKGRCRARAVQVLQYKETDLLTPQEMADLIPLADAAEKWAKDLKATCLVMAEEGTTFNGWKLVEGRSVRKWSDDAERILSTYTDDLWDKKLKGITEMQKLVGKNVVDECTVKPAGKPALVPSTDKRPAIVPSVVEFPIGE